MDRYKAQITSDAAASGANEGESEQMRELMLNMGIRSPVTRSSAGTLYHQQLARQLADFLTHSGRLKEAGGMMTLPDVYCIFNRARGMELISPDDLVEVATILRPLGLAMSIRKFDSGVTVIQSDSHDDRIMGQHIRALASQLGSVTSVDVSAQLRIPLTLAREHALVRVLLGLSCDNLTHPGTNYTHAARGGNDQPPSPQLLPPIPTPKNPTCLPQIAEEGALLCRDECLDAIRFYPNMFSEWA